MGTYHKKCDVLIFSADFGTGHHQVSSALKTAIEQRRPSWKVDIYNFFNYIDPLLDRVLKFGYLQMIKHFSYGYEWFYETTRDIEPDSKWQRFLNGMGQYKLLNLIKKCSPKVIICTFPTPAGVVSQLKRKGKIDIPLVTVITDVTVHSQWIHPNVDAYIVAAETVKERLIERGIPQDKIFALGIPLRPQFERTIIDPRIWKEYNLDPNRFTLLIMGGGKGLMPGIDTICSKLSRLSLPLQVVVITGTNKLLAKKLETISESSNIPIHVLEYVEDVASLMKISQLLLSKAGGVTVFEALASELPMLLYKPLPGHEMCNVEYLIENKTAFIANDEDEAVDHIKKVLENPSILKPMVKAIRSISKPFASRDAARVIIALAEDKEAENKELDIEEHLYA